VRTMQLQLVEGWLPRWAITVAVLFLRHRPMPWQRKGQRKRHINERVRVRVGRRKPLAAFFLVLHSQMHFSTEFSAAFFLKMGG